MLLCRHSPALGTTSQAAAPWLSRCAWLNGTSAGLAQQPSFSWTRELAFEDEAAVEEALFNWHDGPVGFSACLIMAHNRQLGCRSTATFDTRAARLPGASKA